MKILLAVRTPPRTSSTDPIYHPPIMFKTIVRRSQLTKLKAEQKSDSLDYVMSKVKGRKRLQYGFEMQWVSAGSGHQGENCEGKTVTGGSQVKPSCPLQPSKPMGGSEGSDSLAPGHARHPPRAVSKGRVATALGGAWVNVPAQPLVQHVWLEVSPSQKQSRKQLCQAPPHHRPTL